MSWEESTMKVAEIIKQVLKQKGFRNLRDAAKALGISQELLRLTVNKEHLPKDEILGMIADKLGLDRSALILAAHQEKVPVGVKGFFLSPTEQKKFEKKRVWPLSEEQCGYLEKILSETEIQIIRKFRQIPDNAKEQITSYLDYTWAAKRITMKKP
jgi:hypothetical protein